MIGLHELLPGVDAAVLDAQRDLTLLRVIGDDVHIQGIAHGHHLSGSLDAAPAQLGNMYHTVHTADVHKHAIGSHGLDSAGVVLAHFDVGPHLCLSGLAGLLLHGTDGTHHTAAGTVDLSNAQLDLLLDHRGQVSAPGHAALRSGDEYPDTLDGSHQAALVLLSNDALQDGLLLHGLLNVLPDLNSIQTLLGQLGEALHVVDTDNVGLDLVTHLHHVLGLDVGIIAELAGLDVGGLLGAHVHLHLSGGDSGHNTGNLFSCI